MSKLFIPKSYRSNLDPKTTEKAIDFIKGNFQLQFASELKLRRITAPIIVLKGTGINDDLNGIERPVSFPLKNLGEKKAEVVHSLAKWKRMQLADLDVKQDFGIYTDMNALRPDEDLSNIHSIYVDQWDWEKVISLENRNIKYLKKTVTKIYESLKRVAFVVSSEFPLVEINLPDEIHFIHSQELLDLYPNKTSKEREHEICKKYGAVFIIGIGNKLTNGEAHDGRAPDYDDWTSKNEEGFFGLNGDIMLWNPILETSFEISSMGIRVTKEALFKQLELLNCKERTELYFHKRLINGELPNSIGGGIGQSRLCMFLLNKAHIGEVQSSIWPNDMREDCKKANIFLF